MSRFIVVLDIEDEYPGDQTDVAMWVDVAMAASSDRVSYAYAYGRIEDFDTDRAEQSGPFMPGYRAGDTLTNAHHGDV